MELVDLEAARMEALAALGEIAKDQLRDGDHRDFVIDIREGAGPVVLTVSLSLQIERKGKPRPASVEVCRRVSAPFVCRYFGHSRTCPFGP